jgi:hypothetical protein
MVLALARRIAALRAPLLMSMWLCFAAVLAGCGANAEPPGTLEQTHTATSAGDTVRVHFERSGGFGGLLLTVTIESDTLSVDEQQQLRRLIDEADFFNLPAELSDSSGAVDQFVYKVVVESADRSHSVQTTEAAAPTTLQPLLDWLTRAARRKN